MSLSDRVRFKDDELTSVSPWEELENFSATEDEKAPRLTVEEIEKMQQQAYQEAFDQGRQDGFKQGHEEGLKQGKEEGYQQGYAEGLQKGYDENVGLLKQQAETFNHLLEVLEAPFKQLDEKVEAALVNLVISIATQLVRREIKTDRGQIVAVVREAVKALPVASQDITVKLHPDDVELVTNALKLSNLSPRWNIEEDPLLTAGGCIVETGVSHIDATVENRLTAIVAKMLGGQRQEDKANDSRG